MGLGIGPRCSGNPCEPAAVAPNPNPGRFKILKEQVIGKYLVLLVEYPGCTNYEGKKLLVYEGWKSSAGLLFHNLYRLDPHFADNVGAPIARFRPTEESLELIERMCRD